jgi:hypothetical protein
MSALAVRSRFADDTSQMVAAKVSRASATVSTATSRALSGRRPTWAAASSAGSRPWRIALGNRRRATRPSSRAVSRPASSAISAGAA